MRDTDQALSDTERERAELWQLWRHYVSLAAHSLQPVNSFGGSSSLDLARLDRCVRATKQLPSRRGNGQQERLGVFTLSDGRAICVLVEHPPLRPREVIAARGLIAASLADLQYALSHEDRHLLDF